MTLHRQYMKPLFAAPARYCKKIRDTARDFKKDDIIGGTARAIQETSVAMRVTAHTVKDIDN